MRKLPLLFALVFSASFCSGITVWDESVNGDLSSDTNAPTAIGSLGGGNWELFGSLDGGPPSSSGSDEFDVFSFTASGDWTIDLTDLSLANTNSLLSLAYLGSSSSSSGVSFDSTTQNDLFGTLSAGSYQMRLIPEQNKGQVDYSLRINVASVPDSGTTLALLGLAMAGLAVVRRRIR